MTPAPKTLRGQLKLIAFLWLSGGLATSHALDVDGRVDWVGGMIVAGAFAVAYEIYKLGYMESRDSGDK